MPEEISLRKQNEMRQKKKKIIEAIKKAVDSLTDKMEKGESLRDEDLRFLRHVFRDWKVLEESIVEEKEEVLPDGVLKDFIERVYKFKSLGDWEEIAKSTGYYRCRKCGELHLIGKDCMFDEYSVSVQKVQSSNLFTSLQDSSVSPSSSNSERSPEAA